MFEPIPMPTELTVRLPLTQEEIAWAVEDFRVYWSLPTGDIEAPAFLELLLASDVLRFCACECAFAEDVTKCIRDRMRQLRLNSLRRRPRARARRSRQRHGGRRCERGPPGSDDGSSDGGSGPPARLAASHVRGARP